MSGGGQDQPPDIKTIATGAVTKFIQALVSNKPLLKQEISPAPIWRFCSPKTSVSSRLIPGRGGGLHDKKYHA